MKAKASPEEVLGRIPGPAGERFAAAMAHGSMTVEYYAPVDHDPQTPHRQDELYFIHRGTGELVIAGERHPFAPGDCFFVAAGVAHRFDHFSAGFGTWVVFWGPDGGEAS